MGWDDVIIGTGDRGNSAVKVFGIDGHHSISENINSYWVDDCIMGIGCIIMKNTAIGSKIKRMIEQKKTAKEIQEYIDRIVIKNISLSKFEKCLKREQDKYFLMGEKSKLRKIRSALGM